MKPSVWCFAVDPGYLARRSQGTISCESKAWSPFLGSATISMYRRNKAVRNRENQLEHKHPPLASFSSPCPSPEQNELLGRKFCFDLFHCFRYKALPDSVEFISVFCSIQIVLLGVGSYSLLKVEGEKWIGRIACCYVDQLKMRILGLGVVGLKS